MTQLLGSAESEGERGSLSWRPAKQWIQKVGLEKRRHYTVEKKPKQNNHRAHSDAHPHLTTNGSVGVTYRSPTLTTLTTPSPPPHTHPCHPHHPPHTLHTPSPPSTHQHVASWLSVTVITAFLMINMAIHVGLRGERRREEMHAGIEAC